MLWKKTYTVFVAILLFAGLLSFIWYVQPKTPLNALEKYSKDEPTIKYSAMINQINIDTGESLLFYYNENKNLACAVIKKQFGFYKVISVSSEIACNSDSLRAGMLGAGYEDDKTFKCLIWGIIYDSAVKKLVSNNNEAQQFEGPGLRLFYAINEGSLNFDCRLYDSAGIELPLLLSDKET